MAILSNELMIGNWVKDEHRDMYQVTLDNIKWFNAFEPIPLTPEILEKCGFEWEDIVTKSDGGTEKALVKSFVMMLQTVSGTWCAAPFGYPLHPMRTIYLHQLQNLYYALTGTELTYKP